MDAMDIDMPDAGQITDDQRIAQLLHKELNREARASQPSFSGADPLREYRQYLQSRQCVRCHTPIYIEPVELVHRTRTALKVGRFFHPCFPCRGCRNWTCIGQDKYYDTEFMPVLEHVGSAKTFKSTWCCDQGRLFLIFSILCGHGFPGELPKPKPQPKSKQAPKERSRYLQSQLSKGTGYGDAVVRRDKNPQVPPRDNVDTENLELYFQALASLLAPDRQATPDFGSWAGPVIAAMMLRSPLLHVAAEWLRHASIQEIVARRGPTTLVLDFIEAVACHVETCKGLHHERMVLPPTAQLARFVLCHHENVIGTGTVNYETAQPLGAVLEELANPSRRFVETFRKSADTSSEEDQDLLALLQRVCIIADRVESLRGQDTVSVSQWHRANCVKEVPDDVILRSSNYEVEARAAETSKPAPGRMRKLLSQVASLSADLPEGIYVRHGESRVDVLKVLIVGPADTPYEHGLFEFDMFCGSEFPKNPPKMFFRTTGGGRINFNPNLYSNGKICLSLLGTWSGQNWEPEHSTILQILVSIQAMIFNDKPYYNEPGHEYRSNPNGSEGYNRAIESYTVEYALLHWVTQRLACPAGYAPTGSAPAIPAPTTNPLNQGMGPNGLTSSISTGGHAHPTLAKNIQDHHAQLLAMQSAASAHLANYYSSIHAQISDLQATTAQVASTVVTQAQASNVPSAAAQPGTTTPISIPGSTAVAPSANPNHTMPPHQAHQNLPQNWAMPPSHGAPTSYHPSAGQTSAFPSGDLMDFEPDDLAAIQNIQAQATMYGPQFTPAPPPPPPGQPIAPRRHPMPRPPPGPPPKEDDPIWSDVIRHHFGVKASAIMQTVHNWEVKAAGLASAGPLLQTARKLEELLQAHGFTN